ncbi:MAG: glycerate kinase [Bacteroidales bacterium]|nr:glycerate kinase [Bacteroidales bacterium]
MKKIVIASDSFKGSISSMEIAGIVAEAASEVFPGCETVRLEMADGGEGTTDALCRALGGEMVKCEVQGPLREKVISEYAIVDVPGEGLTAVIEMSQASGLPLVPTGLRNPMLTTTFGTGELILDALGRGCRHFLIGIGGSATNDGGTGMLAALGWRFLDSDGKELPPVGASLEKIASVDSSGKNPALNGCTFITACDVDNPFCGPDGAAFVFGPQKGAGPEEVQLLDKGLESFASVIQESTGTNVKEIPGAGAAGGLGGALMAFLGSRLTPGAEMVLDVIGFDSLAEGADLVITGEGKMDGQTLKGKAPLCVLKHASKLGIPTIAIAGMISDPTLLKDLGYKDIICINPPGLAIDEAMNPETARRNLHDTAVRLMTGIKEHN